MVPREITQRKFFNGILDLLYILFRMVVILLRLPSSFEWSLARSRNESFSTRSVTRSVTTSWGSWVMHIIQIIMLVRDQMFMKKRNSYFLTTKIFKSIHLQTSSFRNMSQLCEGEKWKSGAARKGTGVGRQASSDLSMGFLIYDHNFFPFFSSLFFLVIVRAAAAIYCTGGATLHTHWLPAY